MFLVHTIANGNSRGCSTEQNTGICWLLRKNELFEAHFVCESLAVMNSYIGQSNVKVLTVSKFYTYEGLSPCDFDLIPKMKKPLRGFRFRTVPEILQAVDRSIRTINTTGAANLKVGYLSLQYTNLSVWKFL